MERDAKIPDPEPPEDQAECQPPLRVADLQPTMRECEPARAQRDDALLEALVAVTTWRRLESTVTLNGSTPLVFRIPTN